MKVHELAEAFGCEFVADAFADDHFDVDAEFLCSVNNLRAGDQLGIVFAAVGANGNIERVLCVIDGVINP